MDRDKQIEEFANVYANCRNGKQVGVNFTEWQRSFDGCIEGAKWADANTPPLPADVEYLTKQLEIADGNLADCERNLEESIADNDKANERIKALEALAKQMAEALKQILNTKHDKSEWLARRLLAERALDAYKRGINE